MSRPLPDLKATPKIAYKSALPRVLQDLAGHHEVRRRHELEFDVLWNITWRFVPALMRAQRPRLNIMAWHVPPMWKIPLVIANAAGIHMAYTPPNPMPDADEMRKYGSLRDNTRRFKFRRRMAVVAKTIHWVFASCESAVILANTFPTSHSSLILSTLLRRQDDAPAVRVTAEAIIGCTLVITGAGIRLASQHSLGRFFTWEKAVKKDQELITTGPYAVVRHPSYTGMILATAGTLLCHFGPGSWLRQSSLLQFWWGKGLVVVWVGYTVALPCVLLFRTFDEDRVLRAHFPKQWDAWAERVPYRIVPYIF